MQNTNWEKEYYGVTVDKLHSIVRESYVPPRREALSEINYAVCLIQSGMGEANRDEIVQALRRAQWILNNKVSADRPC